MAEIMLPSGEACIVDDIDLPALREIPWRRDDKGYVIAYICKGWYARLHRIVVGASDDDVVDHVNGNKLDNRRINLRACKQEENLRNRKRHSNNRSGFKGVYRDCRSRRNPWRAEIKVDRRKIRLGAFPNAEAAHAAYALAARKYHGEFANLG